MAFRVSHQTGCNTKHWWYRTHWVRLRYQLKISQVILWNGISGSVFSKQPFTTTVASQTPKKWHTSKTLTHKAWDSISGYSYNGDYYHEAIAELTRKFGKSQHIVAAYLDQLEKWPKPRQDEPNTFVSFSSFLSRLVQAFRLHNFEADLKSSAVLRMARDKLKATMIIRWNQHTRNQALLQPNLTHVADRIDSYAEACEDISPQRNQRTRANNSSRRGPPDVSRQHC